MSALPFSARAGGGKEHKLFQEGRTFLEEACRDSVELIEQGQELHDSDRVEGRESVGLVLSGGGAKGIAHVGVIKALEDNGVPIDYVTGTSMGAIVGSLYSCGWSPEEMMALFTSPDFIDWSTGTISKKNIYYYSTPPHTPKWLTLNVNFSGDLPLPTQIIPTSLVSPIPMNIEFLKLYGPYSVQCRENFNDLFVPFRCVTSDVYHKHKIVLGSGSLGDAVRASMSFPMVFRPITIDGVLVYDGGIYDNFPVDVMRHDFDPDFIVGVSVSSADTKPMRGDMYSQLEDMIIQNNDYSLPADKGVKIQVPVLNFGVLAFDKAKTIYDIGYNTGLEMVDSIKSRLSQRAFVPLDSVTARRRRFAAATPPLVFDSVQVTGLKPNQSRYLAFLFEGEGKFRGPFDIDKAEKAYYRAVTDGTLSNLVPQLIYNPDDHNVLRLDATPKRPFSLSIGGWLTTSTNSMLYLSAGYHTLSFNSLDVSLSGWVGQSYLAGMLTGRFTLRSRIPSFVRVDLVASRQKYYDSEVLFYQTNSPTFITESEFFIRGSYVWAMGRKMRGYSRLGFGYVNDRYFTGSDINFSDRGRDRSHNFVGMAKVGIEQSTLDNELYPGSGSFIDAYVEFHYKGMRFHGADDPNPTHSLTWTPAGVAEVNIKHFFPVGRQFAVGALFNGVVSVERMRENYTATLIHSPAFAPTPSTKGYFNAGFRAPSYLAGGVMPMWKPVRNLQLRGDFYVFSPIRKLKNMGNAPAEFGGWFRNVEFMGEIAAVYNLSFASLSIYGNYLTSPAHNWNFGLSFGLYFMAPKLLR